MRMCKNVKEYTKRQDFSLAQCWTAVMRCTVANQILQSPAMFRLPLHNPSYKGSLWEGVCHESRDLPSAASACMSDPWALWYIWLLISHWLHYSNTSDSRASSSLSFTVACKIKSVKQIVLICTKPSYLLGGCLPWAWREKYETLNQVDSEADERRHLFVCCSQTLLSLHVSSRMCILQNFSCRRRSMCVFIFLFRLIFHPSIMTTGNVGSPVFWHGVTKPRVNMSLKFYTCVIPPHSRDKNSTLL